MLDSIKIQLVTHDGPFHGDDVLAIAILSKIHKSHKVIRTRDPSVIDMGDFVVDVGGVYNHDTRRYDHHMPNGPRSHSGQPYSSAGLIWHHYAKQYLAAIGVPSVFVYRNETFDIRGIVSNIIRTKWIIPIDLNDNGVVTGHTPVSDIVTAMAPIYGDKKPESYDRQFMQTVSIVSAIFERACFHAVEKVVRQVQASKAKYRFFSNGRILVSPVEMTNFKSFSETDVHFVIYPVTDFRDPEQQYYVIRPIFENIPSVYKTPIAKHLLGLDADALEELGYSDILFVHHSGFMIRARTEKAAIAFCDHALEIRNQ